MITVVVSKMIRLAYKIWEFNFKKGEFDRPFYVTPFRVGGLPLFLGWRPVPVARPEAVLVKKILRGGRRNRKVAARLL